MAPIRRYLRITKFSVLEVRIYLDNPALAQSWLLNPRAPVLPRVIEAVRPLVLPKLREERERSRKKNDFEVAIFLTETDTRHSILYKDKRFRDKTQTRLRSNSKKLTGGDSADAAINLEGDDDAADSNSDVEVIQAADGDEIPMIRREDSDDDAAVALHNIPAAPDAGAIVSEGRGTKRRRQSTVTAINNNDNGDNDNDFEIVDSDDEDDDLESESSRPTRTKRVKQPAADADEKKKKLAMDITYNSFAIYGRVLCLVVKKRGAGNNSNQSAAAAASGHGKAAAASSRAAGQARMENWIASTQIMPVADQGEEGA
ncbi:uncharacterized protein PgNI_04399 [Pyricularia grisea]|uniref:Uncharacterized protein n=1 Tax=Pyricularia grisea TaxID=148305 RepID=A0A6P8BBA7_PYRGI|nr:uncharacterized protein PgNI_04399 [Pyricularia grisea]TLD12982.1 hypothetical protein PgNI_04399 [Pyricularia grisea]